MRMLVGVVVSLSTLGVQFGFHLVPTTDGPLRWLALILGQCIGFGILAIFYICNAAWKEHEELLDYIQGFKASAEDNARLEAANTLFKSACRVAQALHACSSEFPLKPGSGDEHFKAQYLWYLLLMNDSFITVLPDGVDPLPGEQSDQTRKDISRALSIHLNWLRSYIEQLRIRQSDRNLLE